MDAKPSSGRLRGSFRNVITTATTDQQREILYKLQVLRQPDSADLIPGAQVLRWTRRSCYYSKVTNEMATKNLLVCQQHIISEVVLDSLQADYIEETEDRSVLVVQCR